MAICCAHLTNGLAFLSVITIFSYSTITAQLNSTMPSSSTNRRYTVFGLFAASHDLSGRVKRISESSESSRSSENIIKHSINSHSLPSDSILLAIPAQEFRHAQVRMDQQRRTEHERQQDQQLRQIVAYLRKLGSRAGGVPGGAGGSGSAGGTTGGKPVDPNDIPAPNPFFNSQPMTIADLFGQQALTYDDPDGFVLHDQINAEMALSPLDAQEILIPPLPKTVRAGLIN